MKNISSEFEYNGKLSLENLENHENELLPLDGMGRPDLNRINGNGIDSLAKTKEYLLNHSPLHLSSNDTLNSCERPLLSVSPSYLSSWPDKLNSPCDIRPRLDKCYWSYRRTGRGIRECEKLCMSDGENGAEARGMVRSASLLNICDSACNFLNGVEAPNANCGELSSAENAELSRGCRHHDVQVGRRGSEPLKGLKGQQDCHNGPVSLNAVLESIPIVYNPRTKQLHIISVDSKSAENNCENGCDKAPTKFSGSPGVRTDADGSCEPSSKAGTLQRVSTCGSSISSISSLSTELSVSAASAFDDGGPILDSDEAGFIEINLDRHSVRSERNASMRDPTLADDECAAVQGAKPKRRGLSGFLSRNLLPWKSSREVTITDTSGAAGWKLFGKAAVPSPHRSSATDPNRVIEEYHARQRHQVDAPEDGSTIPRSRRSEELIASSTTALILENRPSHLPAKDPEEEIKHRVQYEQMVEAAKKKELKEAKLKKKLLQQQLRHEEQLSLASKIWNHDILPSWDMLKNSRRTKELWWQGIPPSVRGKVWKLAIGNDLHITPELYEICVCRAKDRIRMAAELISVSEDDVEESDKEGSVQLIKLDVSRTFPQFCIFQKGGPYYDMLHSLLGAYVCYRPDVGYVQGMSFLAAVLILNLDVADAFICFANLLNQPCQLAFFRLDEPMMRSYFLTYEEFFKENMPKLFNHFTRQNLSPDLYLIDWIYTVYSRSLPLDVASRVWDVFFRDGDEFLFRTALGILKLYEDILLNLEFIHLAQFLTKLPEDIAAGPLFRSIECMRMVTDKRNFAQVLLGHAEPKQT